MNKLTTTAIKERVFLFCKGAFIGALITIGLFNVAYGSFIDPNSWQASCGLFQILLAAVITRD